MRWNRMLRVALFLTALLFSCALGLSRALALTPDELVAQGDAFLEARNTVDAYGRYLAARDLDPDHPGANLGLALLNLPDKLVDGGDPAFAAFLATWGVELAGNIFGLEVSRDEEVGLPPVPALQDIIVTCVLPHLDQSLVYLQAVRALPGWERVFTPEMFGFDPSEDEPRKWGLVETHALEVAFNLLKGALNFACAYDLDIDWVDLDGGENGFGWFLENYPQLLTIRAGGPARMDAALAGFRAALDAALAAWDANDARNAAGYLVPPPPGPDDDPWDFTYWADYRALLGDIRALFDDAGGTLDLNRYRVAMWEEVSGSPIIMPLDLNLSRLFSAPLTRADLPEFDDEGEPVFDGFDFTLNGLLPGLTREAALGFIFGDAELWESERHVTIVDGNTIRVAWFHYDGPEELDGIAGFRLYRGDTVNVDENDHLVGQGTVAQLRGPDVPWAQAAFSLTDPAAPADSYFYRLYIDYHDGYYTTSDSLPAFRRVYVDRHYAGPEPEEGTAARPFRWLGLAGQVLAPGTAMYVAGGEYRVADDFSGDDPGGLNIRASGVRVVGSCNPNDWNHADINVFPTVIDVAGFWWGVAVFTPDWRQHEGPVENISIENLVVRDSRGAGIQVNGARDVTVRNCLVRGSGQWNFRGGIEFNHVEGLRVEHCTAVDNSRGITGSMISGQVELVGNIAAWNGGEGVSLGAGGGGPPVFLFTHNNAWGNNPDFGQDSDFSHLVGLDGNISENPRFENRAAGDYRPAWDSPCAGAGPGGSDMGALAAAPPETGIPGWRAWWEGIGVGDWEAAPGAGVFEDYSGDGELNIFKFFRGAPPDEVRAGDPAWTTADLAGDWDVHGVTVIHRAGRADPAVWRGTATVDDEGRFLLEDMTGLLIDQGRLHAGPDGLVALVGRDYSFGAFQPGGRHFFLGMNRWLPAKAAREEVFTAFARRTRGDVTVADFAGHHAKHSLRLAENQWQNPGIIGPVPSDEVFFNAEGGMIVHGIEVARLVPDGPAGHFDFENPGPEPQPTDIFGAGDFAAGVLGDGLAPFIGRWLDGQGDPAEWEFGFLVRAGGEFRQADLAGRWAAVGFDSGGAWHCAFVDIDEEYLPGQPNVRVRTMPGLPGSEEFQAQINITGDGAIFTPAGTWWGQMDRSGNLVVIRDVHGDMLEERGVRALVRTTAGYEPPAPEIASVAPAAAWPVRPVPVVIAGDHFQPGAAVALVNGAVEAPGSEISVNGRREITAVFDPGGWGLAPGFYDVLVVNPDGQAALLAGGFEVRALEEGAGPRRLSLHLSGPAVAHPGARGLLFRVTCANESAAPVPAVTVSVFLPDEFGGGVVPFDFGVLPAGAAATATFTVDVAGGAVPGARVLTGAEARAGGELCDDRSLLTRITGRYDFAAELLSSPAWAGFPKRYQCRVTLRGHRPGTLLPAELRAALLAAPGAVVTVDFDHRLGGLWGAAPGHGTLHHGQKRFTLTGPQLVGLLEDPDRGGEVAVAWHVPPPPLPGPDEVLVATMRIDLPPGIVDPDPADNFARRENPFSAAIDPNAIHAAPPGYVRPGQAIIYTIEFENEFEGDPFGAPAPRVRTVITLDENLVFDDGTFDYRPEFANLDIFDPAPLVRDEADFKVTFSDVSRRVAWKFDSLFLPGRPPGGDEGSGGGGTLYLKTRVRPDAPCGAEISMAATNYFLTLLDEEIDSLATDPPAVHVVDGTPPVSGVSVPAVSVAPGFTVVWAASDEHSGIKKVTVYGAAVGAGYEPLAVAEFALDNLDAGPGEVVSGAVPFTGELGRAYRFYSVAADRAGNVQAPSAPAVVMLGLMGDLDGDGRVTVADALLALRIALGQVAPTPAQLVLGDLVAPAGIHAADVIAILRRAAGP